MTEMCSACGKHTDHKRFYDHGNQKSQCNVCGYTK